MPTPNVPGLAPTANLPGFLQGNSPWKPLNQFATQLPALFNTDQQRQNVENQISGNFDSGRSAAAAASSRYANTASQTGGSAQGAGFAGAQAMLPFYRQANDARAAFGQLDLQARSQRAGIGADLASRMGQLMSARQGQQSDFFQGQQRLNQGNQQFNADLGFRQQQLAQNQTQFGATLGQRNHEFDVTSGQQNFLNHLQALQALGVIGGAGGGGKGGGGTASFSFNVNNNNQPMGPEDVGGFNAFNTYRNNLASNSNLPGMLLGGGGGWNGTGFTSGIGGGGGGSRRSAPLPDPTANLTTDQYGNSVSTNNQWAY